jgi:hypothetical protein
MNRSWLVLIAVALGVAAGADEPPRRKGPLADLPSKPGPHVEKIRALGDNEWLSLGKPAPDPKWGSARGRAWSSNQPAAPNLRGGFVFAEGVHGFTKPDGRYMNDLWFYDINAHRWVCAYPGIEVKTVARRIKDGELTLNADGLMVDRRGEPLPPLLIHAYGNLGYDPERKQFLTLGDQFGNYFTWGKGAAFQEAYRLYQEKRVGKKFPGHSPFLFDTASGKFECAPVKSGPDGKGNFGADVLAYVGSRKEFFYGGTHGVWYFNAGTRKWTDAKPRGVPPTGIDHCAAYDPKRDRVYYHQQDGKTPADNFLIYDVKTNRWSKPNAKGAAPLSCTSYQSIYNYDAANDKLVVIRLYDGRDRQKDEPALRRGVYVYDPQTNTWADPLPFPAKVVKGIKNGNFGFYDPELNAYFCYFAGDSADDGSMWVYRYKRRP